MSPLTGNELGVAVLATVPLRNAVRLGRPSRTSSLLCHNAATGYPSSGSSSRARALGALGRTLGRASEHIGERVLERLISHVSEFVSERVECLFSTALALY